MPYGSTTSCPKHDLELTSPPHYEFPKESVEAIKLPHALLAFASQRGFLLLQCRSTEINGFHLKGSLAAGKGVEPHPRMDRSAGRYLHLLAEDLAIPSLWTTACDHYSPPAPDL